MSVEHGGKRRVKVKSVYLIGSYTRGESFRISPLDYLLFIDIVPPGYVYLVAAPRAKAIVLPNPSLTCSKLLNPVTGRASAIYTSRIAAEPKIRVYGDEVELREDRNYDDIDLKHYILYLWIMYKTSKRKHLERLPCKILYEVLWLEDFLEDREISRFSWRILARKHQDDELAQYCLEVLLDRHLIRDRMYHYILDYSLGKLDVISRNRLGESLNDIIWDIEFFRQTAPRIGEGTRIC